MPESYLVSRRRLAMFYYQLFQNDKDFAYILTVSLYFFFHFGQLEQDVLVGHRILPDFRKDPYYPDVYIDGCFAVQYTGKHCYSLLCKCIGKLSSPSPT